MSDGNVAQKNSKYTKDEDVQAEVDKELENGPVFKRSCTDCLCCPLFAAFCVGMVWALIYGLSNGNPYKLTTMFDYDGNGCGYHSRTKDFKLVWWPSITYTTSISEVLGRTICVKYCPTMSSGLGASDCFPNTLWSTCTGITVSYDSKSYVDKMCIPDTSSASSTTQYSSFKDGVLNEYGGKYVSRMFGDVWTCWYVCI